MAVSRRLQFAVVLTAPTAMASRALVASRRVKTSPSNQSGLVVNLEEGSLLPSSFFTPFVPLQCYTNFSPASCPSYLFINRKRRGNDVPFQETIPRNCNRFPSNGRLRHGPNDIHCFRRRRDRYPE